MRSVLQRFFPGYLCTLFTQETFCDGRAGSRAKTQVTHIRCDQSCRLFPALSTHSVLTRRCENGKGDNIASKVQHRHHHQPAFSPGTHAPRAHKIVLRTEGTHHSQQGTAPSPSSAHTPAEYLVSSATHCTAMRCTDGALSSAMHSGESLRIVCIISSTTLLTRTSSMADVLSRVRREKPESDV